MAGVVITPVPASNCRTPSPSPSCDKALRISKAVDRLLAYARGPRSRNDSNEICRLCIILSRDIDYSVANNEIPDKASELPYLLKQVCKWTNDTHLLSAIMVLMISIKGACRNGWFGEKDNEELHIIWTEITKRFCSAGAMNSGESTVNDSISTVMLKFYPRMKMGEIFAFIEAAPGYGAFVKDFHLTKDAKSPHEEVYLFVAQTDNMDTSACITSPQLVNFLLNGKAVDRRTCIYKEPGPQIPTPVTDMVKNGTNLLQVVGQFNGKYLIVVAFMSMITNPICPTIPDYVQPVAAASDLDNDIVEGPSRISLNCPISLKRITIPVKGHLCKHLQCFDFENYVHINSKKPSWRCPQCSQSVCFTDIRIDQVMAKVLKEVGTTISHMKFSADGSWEVVNECDDHVDKQQDKSLLHQESNPSSNIGGDIMDLTKEGNDIDASDPHQANETKPSLAQLQDQPNLNINHVHTNISPHMEYQHEYVISDTRPNVTISQGQTVVYGSNSMQLPLPTHAIAASSTVMNPNFQGQSQTEIPAYSMQFQQHTMNHMSNGYGERYTTPSRHVTRIPSAIQGLPAQAPAGMVSDLRTQVSRFYLDQYQMHTIAASNPSMFDNTGSQNWVHHGLPNVSSQPAQQFGANSSPFQQSSGHQFNSYQHQPVNHMLPDLVQSPFVGTTIDQLNNHQAHHHVGPSTGSVRNQQAHRYIGPIPASQAFHPSGWTPPTPTPPQTSLSSMPGISSEEQRGLGQVQRMQEGSASANALADQNWRPSARMRGSLSGQAYLDALSQSMVNPTQPVQAANPPLLNTPRPFIPDHLRVIVENNRNANGFHEGAGGSVLDGIGGAGVLP